MMYDAIFLKLVTNHFTFPSFLILGPIKQSLNDLSIITSNLGYCSKN